MRGLAFSMVLALACDRVPSSPAPEDALPAPALESVAALDTRVDVELELNETLPIGGSGITVTLVSGSQDRIKLADGRIVDQTTGRVKLSRAAESVEIDFVSGRAFEAFGHPMAVFGTAGWLELAAFPPGHPVRP